ADSRAFFFCVASVQSSVGSGQTSGVSAGTRTSNNQVGDSTAEGALLRARRTTREPITAAHYDRCLHAGCAASTFSRIPGLTLDVVVAFVSLHPAAEDGGGPGPALAGGVVAAILVLVAVIIFIVLLRYAQCHDHLAGQCPPAAQRSLSCWLLEI